MRPPQYLEQVETYIGLPFFSDPALSEQVRIDPAQLPQEELVPRATLYFAALRLLRSAQSAPLPPDDQTQLDRTRAIGTIRGELMTIDEGLETPAVRALREALASASEEPRPPVASRTREHRGAAAADVLPVWALPSQVVNSIVNMSSGGVVVAMRHRGMEVPKLKLAGSRVWEACCDWEFVREMTALHGLRPELVGEIDLDRLPRSRDDDDPDRHDYARQLQLRFVPHEKLRNIPELVPLLPPEPTYPLVRPYHISRVGLDRVLGGGYSFIDAYCKEHKIGFIPLRIARSGAVGRFMLLEEAAQIWEIYSSIQVASPDDITLIQAATEVDVSKGFFRDKLTPDEVAVLADKRALRPKGRVLPHLPAEVALRAMDRLRRGPLPPHLIPAQVLDKYFDISYSGIMRASYDLQVDGTRRRLIGTDKTQSCFSWEFVRTLKEQRKVALREAGPTIDFSRLPMNEFDLNPDRIEYARHVQSLLVNHPDQVDQTPIEKWVAARRRAMSENISAANVTLVAEESEPALQAPSHDPECPAAGGQQ